MCIVPRTGQQAKEIGLKTNLRTVNRQQPEANLGSEKEKLVSSWLKGLVTARVQVAKQTAGLAWEDYCKNKNDRTEDKYDKGISIVYTTWPNRSKALGRPNYIYWDEFKLIRDPLRKNKRQAKHRDTPKSSWRWQLKQHFGYWCWLYANEDSLNPEERQAQIRKRPSVKCRKDP